MEKVLLYCKKYCYIEKVLLNSGVSKEAKIPRYATLLKKLRSYLLEIPNIEVLHESRDSEIFLKIFDILTLLQYFFEGTAVNTFYLATTC